MDIVPKFLESARKRVPVWMYSVQTRILLAAVVYVLVTLIPMGLAAARLVASTTEQRTRDSYSRMSVQTRDNLDFILRDLRRFVEKSTRADEVQRLLTDPAAAEDAFSRKQAVTSRLTSFLISRPEISYLGISTPAAVFTSKEDGLPFFTELNMFEYDNGSIVRRLENTREGYVWGEGDNLYPGQNLNALIFLELPLREIVGGPVTGVVTAGIKKRMISSRLLSDAWDFQGLMVVFSGQTMLFTAGNDTGLLALMPQVPVFDGGIQTGTEYLTDKLEALNGRAVWTSNDSEESGFRLVSLVSDQRSRQGVQGIYTVTFRITAGCVLLAIFLAVFFARRIGRPVRQLGQMTELVGREGLDAEPEVPEETENSHSDRLTAWIFGRHNSLGNKLRRFYLVIGIVPALVLSGTVYRMAYDLLSEQTRADYQLRGGFIQKRIELQVQTLEKNVRGLIFSPAVQNAMKQTDGNTASLENAVMTELTAEPAADVLSLWTPDGTFRYGTTHVAWRSGNARDSLWFAQLSKTQGEPVWQHTEQDTLGRTTLSLNQRVNSVSTEAYTVGDNLGYLRISLREEWLGRTYAQAVSPEVSEMAVLDADGRVLSSTIRGNVGVMAEPEISEAVRRGERTTTLSHHGSAFLVCISPGKVNGWTVISRIPVENTRAAISSVLTFNMYILLASVILMLVLSVSLSATLTSPARKLHGMMRRVERGDMAIPQDTGGRDEISLLGQSFIRMVHQLKKAVAGMVALEAVRHQAELRQKEAELAALAAQINPHFLYNTLESIRMMNVRHGDVQAARMIRLLSELFRYSVRKGSRFVTVEEEVAYLEKYLEIQKMRFRERMETSVDIDDEILGFRTLRFILQPVVENAFAHAFEHQEGVFRVHIRGFRQGHTMVFVIADNGSGIPQQRLEDIRKLLAEGAAGDTPGIGIGLKNVRDRLVLNYGLSEPLDICSPVGEGTTVTLRMPAETEDTDGDGGHHAESDAH